MDRETGLQQVNDRVKNPNLVNHMLAVEAVMKGLAKRLNEDEEKWGICGLIHDIDYEETAEIPEKHSLVAEEILKELGYPEDVIYAVKVHNEIHGFPRVSLMDKCLWSADPVTGLITASALVTPEKKLENVTVESVLKKMKKKDFAKGASREQIKAISEAGIELNEFIEISLDSMKEISNALGL